MRYDSLILPKETPMLTTDRDQILLERLNRHPLLRTRMEGLLLDYQVFLP